MLGRTPWFLAAIFSLSCLASASVAASDLSIAEHPLLKFRVSNEAQKVGDPSATLFIAADVSFPKDEIILSATLDGAPLNLSKTAPALWLSALPVFHEVKTHLIEIRVSIRRAQEAKRIQDAIQANDVVIFELNQKIAMETDPVKLAALQALRTEKLALKARLEAELAALAIFLKAETYSFYVAPSPSDSNYPYITRLNPGVGLVTGGSEVKVRGRNFLSNPEVKISGVTATVVSATDTLITVIAPALTSLGAHDVEVRFPASIPFKNTVLRAGYFAADPMILKNVKPVAVLGSYTKVIWPNPPQVQLDSTASYDENGDAWSAQWKVVKSPAGSSFVPGSIFSTAKKPKVTPDRQGFFVFELVTKESATSELLSSLPASTTLEVNP